MTSFFSYVYFQKGKHNQKMRLLIDLWRQIHRPLDSWRSWSNQKTFMLALWCQSVFRLVIIANLPNYYHLLFLKCIRSLFWNGINYQLISRTHVSRNATVKDVAQSRTYLGQGICNSYFDVKRWSYYYSTTFKRNDDHTREKIKLSFVAIWSLHRVWMWLLSTCCQFCCVCTFRSSFSSQRMCVYLRSCTFKGDRQSEMDIYPLTLSFTFSWSCVKTSQK